MCQLAIILLALAAQDNQPFIDDPPKSDEAPRHMTCGVVAIYNLLRVEGLPADIRQVVSFLPPEAASGDSLYDLRAAARKLGLRVEGISLADPAMAARFPLIAHLKSGVHGHFVVIRPVGHSGELIQIMDGLGPPMVVDAKSFARETGWTDIGIARVRGAWLQVILLFIVFCSLAILGANYRRRWRNPLARGSD